MEQEFEHMRKQLEIAKGNTNLKQLTDFEVRE